MRIQGAIFRRKTMPGLFWLLTPGSGNLMPRCACFGHVCWLGESIPRVTDYIFCALATPKIPVGFRLSSKRSTAKAIRSLNVDENTAAT